jgi:DNA polymerase III delta prime subunit
MSDTQEAPKLSLLEQFKQQREAFVQQGGQLQVQFQQLQGAIFACDQMILKIEEEAKQHLVDLAKQVQGECQDGQVDQQEQGEAAQE